MKSKIIKVSIILIFTMFSACFFNFCFALSLGTDFEIINTITFPNNKKLNFVKSNLDYVLPNIGNVIAYTGENINIEDFIYAYNNNGYVLSYSNHNKDYRLELLVPSVPNTVLSYHYFDNSLAFRFVQNGDYTYTNTAQYLAWYNFNTSTWTCAGPYTNYGYGVEEYKYPIDCQIPIYNDKWDIGSLVYIPNSKKPHIDIKVSQTGVRTGHVELISKNWDGHMYYVKDDMDELVRLIAEEELSPIHSKVKHYDGPIAIEYGEYVMAMLFDDNNQMIFSEISNSVTINHDSILDNEHKLHLNKEDENIYYLSIHGFEEGDYVKVSDVSINSNLYDESDTLILNNGNNNYNGLSIGYLYETELYHMNRKITVNKNGTTYFYLYDKNDKLINSVILNSSNFYSGEEYDFDVELSYGNCFSDEGVLGIVPQEMCTWVKVKPIIYVPSIANYELYFRIKDYGNIGYVQEEYRKIGLYHDNQMKNPIGFDTKNSPTSYVRIDDLIYDYFYIATNQDGTTTFTFSLELRSKSGQVIETKEFKVNLSEWNKEQGTVSSTTNGKDDTHVRNPNELSGTVSNSNKFDFTGLNDLSEQDLKTNVEGLINSSIGFFGLFSTIFLLLPTWISSLLYLFFFGIIIITLLRFIRGA